MVLCWTAGTPAAVCLTVSVPGAALQIATPAVAMLVSGGLRIAAGCLWRSSAAWEILRVEYARFWGQVLSISDFPPAKK